MRPSSLAAAVLIAASPFPALAQDAAGPMPAEPALDDLSETLGDPETQDRLTGMIVTLSEVLLDLPLAPLAEAAAEMAGEDPAAIDPDLRLRDMAPDAERVPGEVADNLPRMMDAMAGMAGGLEAMIPALREMAARMEAAMEETR